MFKFLLKPFLQLYLQYKLANLTFRFAFAGVVFTTFKSGLDFVIEYFLSKLSSLDFPCTASYILNELQIFTMLSFGLSIFVTIVTGRFILRVLLRFV